MALANLLIAEMRAGAIPLVSASMAMLRVRKRQAAYLLERECGTNLTVLPNVGQGRSCIMASQSRTGSSGAHGETVSGIGIVLLHSGLVRRHVGQKAAGHPEHRQIQRCFSGIFPHASHLAPLVTLTL